MRHRADAPAAPELQVWRPTLRLAHWTLAGCVLGCLWLYQGGPWHLGLGYVALLIATWRVWRGLGSAGKPGDLGVGIPGGPIDERFAHFVRGPAATLAYLRALLRHNEPRHLGHNPLGAWMILALLSCALLAGMSGALYNTDRFWKMSLDATGSISGSFELMMALTGGMPHTGRCAVAGCQESAGYSAPAQRPTGRSIWGLCTEPCPGPALVRQISVHFGLLLRKFQCLQPKLRSQPKLPASTCAPAVQPKP